jgi:imidazolonepropionase-like amidohydrolase
MCTMLPLAVKAGVRLCIGDDYGAPIMPHGTYGRELAVYAEHAGIKPLEVIRWATRNGGILMGRQDLGLIRRGMLADMIVVHGDPLKNLHLFAEISNIRLVIKGGVVVHDSLDPVAMPVRAVS